MISCKKCESKEVVRNGKVRGLQRYKCKKCCCNFIEGDKRMKKDVAIKKALCVLLYTLSKASFRFLGKLLGVSHTLPYHWIRKEAEGMKDPEISGDIEEIEFDEMWHFLKKNSKKMDHQSH